VKFKEIDDKYGIGSVSRLVDFLSLIWEIGCAGGFFVVIFWSCDKGKRRRK
jgi:hypothetical protein